MGSPTWVPLQEEGKQEKPSSSPDEVTEEPSEEHHDAPLAVLERPPAGDAAGLLLQQHLAGALAKDRMSAARKLADALLRPGPYWLFHSMRLFNYMFILPGALYCSPLKTMSGLLAYAAVHRQQWWQRAVHNFLGYGASRQHRIISPTEHLIQKDKRYLFSIHPHSILADGWHSIIARNLDSFEPGGEGPPGIGGRKIALCFAPVIQHVPVHQEMYRKLCGGADRRSIEGWWKTPDTDPALMPGGFPESVFADAGQKQVEYSYIKDRKGFIKIALEARKDIIPIYTFKSTWMYHNPGYLKGMRARLSQKISLGLAIPWGKLLTAMPVRDDTVTVLFPPFPVTSFEKDQVDQCHAAYLEHLKVYFDKYKESCGMPGVELEFVGRDFQDDDAVARALRKIGLLGKQKVAKQDGNAEMPLLRSRL